MAPLPTHSALTKVQAVFALVAGSGLPWPLPPWRAEPEALPSSGAVCAHTAGQGNKGGPSPGLGCHWGRPTQHSAQGASFLAVPWLLCPAAGSFIVICKRGETRACVPHGEGREGAAPGAPVPLPCPRCEGGPICQPPGALSPPQGLLFC